MSKVILFSKEEVDFASRGLGTLKECIICTIKERKNGLFELYMEYPLYGRKTDLIQEERVIQTSTPRGDNIFRIYNIKQDDKEGIKKVYASQIFYDLEDNFIEDTNIINKDGIGAINQLLDKTQYTHKFKGLSDIANIANSRLVRRSPVTAIMDTSEENSLLNRWGGEIQRDNFNISLLTRYGSDRGVKIKYGKNLLGLTVETNMKAVATKIMPQGFDGLFLPEKYVDSPLLGSYAHPKILKYEFPSIKAQVEGEELKEGELPLEQAYQALREEVNKLYSEQKIDIPPTNLKVNFLELVKTEEYKNYAVLERVYPFDTVTIKHSRLNLNIKVDMVYYEWDSLRDRYITIEFGNTISSFVETVARIATVKRQMDELEASALKEAKETATGLINNGLGGYILKTRDELLIMDTDNINTAQKVWRWNLAGLGYSSTGYNGEFGLAMTRDGAIVADFITAGILNASIIKTGLITSANGKVSIDIGGTTGVVITGGSLIVKNNNAEVVIDGQHNMHKIMASGTFNITFPAGQEEITYGVPHNFGYKPCVSAYADNLDQDWVAPFPFFNFTKVDVEEVTGESFGIGFAGRVGITPYTFSITLTKCGNYLNVEQHYTIRYYIYKEVAI